MFTSGFFNSVNSDRKYNSEQMSAIFDGLITDGIFDTIGDHFQVTPGDGLTVSVGTGRAWLNQTWSYNDSLYPLQLSAASPTLGRKDLICIKVDKSNAVRANSIVLIEGTPASTPVEPTVTDDTTNGIYYHKLAAVTVPAGATAISAADIYNYIGLSTGTPYVTGIIETTAVDELWSQWDGEFNDWWENTIKPIINTETVTRLQNNIDHITPKETTMNLYGFSHLDPPPSGKTYQEYSTDAILNQISSLLNEKANTSSIKDVVSFSGIAIPSIIPESYDIQNHEYVTIYSLRSSYRGSGYTHDVKLTIANSVTVNSSGTVSLVNPSNITLTFTGTSSSVQNVIASKLRSKYWKLTNKTPIYYSSSTANCIYVQNADYHDDEDYDWVRMYGGRVVGTAASYPQPTTINLSYTPLFLVLTAVAKGPAFRESNGADTVLIMPGDNKWFKMSPMASSYLVYDSIVLSGKTLTITRSVSNSSMQSVLERNIEYFGIGIA